MVMIEMTRDRVTIKRIHAVESCAHSNTQNTCTC
jgi:hypothetical protein